MSDGAKKEKEKNTEERRRAQSFATSRDFKLYPIAVLWK